MILIRKDNWICYLKDSLNVILKDYSSLCVCVILKFNNGLGRERRQSSILHFRLNAHISNSVLCLLLNLEKNRGWHQHRLHYRESDLIYRKEDVNAGRSLSKKSKFKGLWLFKGLWNSNFHSFTIRQDKFKYLYRVNCHAILLLSIQLDMWHFELSTT